MTCIDRASRWTAAAFVALLISGCTAEPGASQRPPSAIPSASLASAAPSAALEIPDQVASWSPQSALQDWPGSLRKEPAGGAPVVFLAHGSDEPVGYDDPPGDVRPSALAVVDVLQVAIREGCWGSLTTEACVFFHMGAPGWGRDPRTDWIAYGIVVDNNGDGLPDLRFGIDNADDGGARMWQIDLATHTTRAFGESLEGDVMDADVGHIWVRHPGNDFRFYVWASKIRGGEVVATDYAPDFGWIKLHPRGG